APRPRPSATPVPRSSASRHTVFVPPASMPSTCMCPLTMLLSAGSMVGPVVRCTVAALCAALGIAWCTLSAQDEVRQLSMVGASLVSPSSIATMVTAAKVGSFNTLVVQIRGRGDAFFQQSLEPPSPSLAAQPLFDPLATAIAEAHAAGLRVHAWI